MTTRREDQEEIARVAKRISDEWANRQPNLDKIANDKVILAVLEEKYAKRRITQMDMEQELATVLHENMCRDNHTDGCSWGYEDWDAAYKREHSAKLDYLSMAHAILKIVDFDNALSIAAIVSNKYTVLKSLNEQFRADNGIVIKKRDY